MLSAVAFLTPFGPARPPAPRALAWFPLVGIALGLLLGGVWWAAARIWPAAVAAAVVVAADLALTGMLHFDGLVDSADGLLPHLDRDRRLVVMADPATGAFGVGTGAAVLLARWTALAALRPAILLLAGIWCLSRTAMGVIARSQPYARTEGGLASAFAGSGATVWPGLLLGVAASFALACTWRLEAGAASLAAGAAAGAAVVWLARRRIGGYTGDVLGASGLVIETVGLLVAAARW